MSSNLEQRAREIVAGHARLSVDMGSLADSDDLFLAGMSSQASINVMLALEAEFDVEFPDRMLQRSTFSTVESIAGALSQLVDKARL